MAKWYDPFLTKDERRLQVGQKGIRARNRAKEMGVNTGEPKQVQNDKSTAVSRSSRAGIIRENAKRENGVEKRAVPNSNSRARIERALVNSRLITNRTDRKKGK